MFLLRVLVSQCQITSHIRINSPHEILKDITYIVNIQVLFICVVINTIIIIHLSVNNNKHKDNNKMRYILVMEFSGYNIYYDNKLCAFIRVDGDYYGTLLSSFGCSI